jgi:hypothetical protein
MRQPTSAPRLEAETFLTALTVIALVWLIVPEPGIEPLRDRQDSRDRTNGPSLLL